MATKGGRQHCRNCGALAGITRNICDGCRMGEVRAHRKAKRLAVPHEGQVVHESYGESLATLRNTEAAPRRRKPKSPARVPASVLGVHEGLKPRGEGHQPNLLANAGTFAATLAAVPSDKGAAQVFFSFNRARFYTHVKALLKTLDVRKRVGSRKRAGPVRARKNVMAGTTENRALSQALRLIRLYMQEEIISLALKLDCSKSQIWHLEIAENVVQHRWVERYAKVFDFETQAIYRFAAALGTGPSWQGCAKDMLSKFYQHLLCPTVPQLKALPEPAIDVAKMQEISGAALHTPRPRAGPPRTKSTGRPMNRALGQALRYFRLARDIEIPYFAAAAMISASHIYNLELDRKAIANHWVDRYAKVLCCEAAHIWAFADVLFTAGPSPDAEWLRLQYEEICTAPGKAFG